MSGQKLSLPRVTYTNVPAQIKVSNAPHKVLIVGLQEKDTNTGKLFRNIGNDGSHKILFGRSPLTQMIDTFKLNNQVTEVDVIPLFESGNGKSVSTFALGLTGQATDKGSITLYVEASRKAFTVQVAKDDTAGSIAEALNKEFNDNRGDCLFGTTLTDSTITFTSTMVGIDSSYMGIAYDLDCAGITATLVHTPGDGEATLGGCLDVIGDTRYQTLIWQFSNTTVATDLFDGRWNVENDVRDGMIINCTQDTLQEHLKYLNGVNHISLVRICNGVIDTEQKKGGTIFENPWNLAAHFGSIRALRLTESALLTQFLTSIAARDQFGGPALGSLPYFNTLLPHVPPMEKGIGFSASEVKQLTDVGGTVIGNNQSQTGVIMGEAVTPYKYDNAGNPDPTYHFLNSVDEQSIAREYFYVNTKKRFAQSRLTKGAVLPDRDMANVEVIRAFLIGLYGDLAGEDFVIVQAGAEYVQYFKDNLKVELDLVKGRVQISMIVCFMSQAREWFGVIEYGFDIEG